MAAEIERVAGAVEGIAGARVVGPMPRDIGGTQMLVVFPNSFGLSIVEGPGTYGVEAATIVVGHDGWEFVDLYDGDSIHGHMTPDTLLALAERVAGERGI